MSDLFDRFLDVDDGGLGILGEKGPSDLLEETAKLSATVHMGGAEDILGRTISHCGIKNQEQLDQVMMTLITLLFFRW